MHAYIRNARRAALLALLVIAAACSSDKGTGTAVDGGNDGGQNGGGNNGGGNNGGNNGSTIFSVDVTGADEVVVGYMGQLQATAKNEAGAPVQATVTWTTSNAAIVAVDQFGNLTGRGPGSALVTAMAGGKSQQREVRVVPRRVTYMEKDTHQSPILQRGDVGFLGVVTLDQHRQYIEAPITYTAADPSIIEVRGSDLVARKGGATTVTATSQGVSMSGVLRVAETTMYPLRRISGQSIPALLMESKHTDENGVIVTRRLVATAGYMVVSNIADQWKTSLTVEEWEFRQHGENGSTIGGMVKAETQVATGTFTIDADTKALLLREGTSTRVDAWAMPEQWPRGFRVHDTSAQPSGFVFEYARW